jgi:alkylation response protein AidB-like acyl-CoA dehydrogenase
LDFSLTPEQIRLCNKVRQFANSELSTVLDHFSRERWERCGAEGLLGLTIPREFGGQELDEVSLVLVLESLGRGCLDNGLSFSIGAHLLAGCMPIWKFGTTEQQRELLPKLCSGEHIVAHALTEEASGSDVFAMESVAVLEGDSYQLKGRKSYCTNAPVADWLLVYALTDPNKGSLGGVSLFVLPALEVSIDAPVPKMGLESCLMGNFQFDTTVSKTSLLGRPGIGAMAVSEIMTWEKIGLSAIQLGILDRLLESVAGHCRKRTVFGSSLSKFQAVSHPLAEIKTNLEAGRWLTRNAAWMLTQGQRARMEASRAKLFVSELYKRSTLAILQIYGARGYTQMESIERELRDSIAATLYSGTSEIQRNLIASELF